MGECLLRPLHAAALRAHRECPRDVATELHGDAAALKQSAPVRTALLRLKVVKAAPPSWDLWLPGHPGESRSPEQSPSYLADKAPMAPTSAVLGSPGNLQAQCPALQIPPADRPSLEKRLKPLKVLPPQTQAAGCHLSSRASLPLPLKHVLFLSEGHMHWV